MKYLLAIPFLFIQTLFAQQHKINQENLNKHIHYLASDKLSGREPGTRGELKATKYIEEVFENLHFIPKGENGFRQTFIYHTKKSPHDTVFTGGEKKGTNVVGFLDNGKPYTIVFGGHYDHLGKKGHSSSLDKNSRRIHNGADDNASGTAGVLELARYYQENGITEACNFLFICFSGEEDGLIGSKYFTNHPTFDLNKVSCMINMDMIGRLNDSTHKLMVYGVGTSPSYNAAFEGSPSAFKLVFDSSGIGPSDQTSFYLKNIPVLHFFTGQHSDYHKSTDDADKINYAGETEVLEYIINITDRLSTQGKMPFTQTRNQEQNKVSFKVTLGIMPDYSYEGKGVKVDAATDGKPAARAGIKAGDIIMGLGDHVTNDMQGYMKALSAFNKGQSTQATIIRDNKELKLDVTF